MQVPQRGPSSAILAAYVAFADITIWLVAFPLELACRSWIWHARIAPPLLLGVLVLNVLLLAFVLSAAAATLELLRRGLTLPAPSLARAFRRAHTTRSAR